MNLKLLFIAPGLVLASRFLSAQQKVTLSGIVKDKNEKRAILFANVVMIRETDSSFAAGTITKEDGRFIISDITGGNYLIHITHTGYDTKWQKVPVGQLASFLDLGVFEIVSDSRALDSITVLAKKDAISSALDKKTFTISENISQSGGSVLQAMKALPGITDGEEGKLLLRGSNKVMVLIDGKQTALTGFGGQSGLDNIPATAIEKIEIINNPSARYDANGNAGIINIIFKKQKKEGFNGKAGLSTGLGALWIKKSNYPSIRPQYQRTPKINPSLSLNYRKNKVNLFFQGDDLYTQTLNKNEFADRYYDSGEIVKQQTKRNRNTNIVTAKTGIDWNTDDNNTITVSGLFSSEKILDRGDEPFFNSDLLRRSRLWQFLEDELKTTVTASAGWQHTFAQPGRLLNVNFNYTFHREDEKYFFTNILPGYTGLDSFKLISDEQVSDITMDYVRPLRHGRFEGGFKFRSRFIPTNMQFKPGLNSPLDSAAGGWADYAETIPALYGNYIFENTKLEVEAGLRLEYVRINYKVNPNHKSYVSNGYNYTQPFPNIRLAYKINETNKLSLFYNRRVDRPNEVDIRIFPKYDDVEIIKVGNPDLRPQFTNSFEMGYKTGASNGYLFSSVYHKRTDATITRIGSVIPGSTLIYAIFQNAGKSYQTGLELIFSKNISKWATINLNLNGYKNIIDSFTVLNKYPVSNIYRAERDEIFSGNIKFNALFHFPGKTEAQLTAIYQAPDLIPQGKVFSRFSVDVGFKKIIQSGRGEIFINATDIANTLNIRKEIIGSNFRYISSDYYETQVVRLGYSYKF